MLGKREPGGSWVLLDSPGSPKACARKDKIQEIHQSLHGQGFGITYMYINHLLCLEEA